MNPMGIGELITLVVLGVWVLWAVIYTSSGMTPFGAPGRSSGAWGLF